MKTTLLFSALLLPLSVAAQTVSSPNGAISVSFSLADGGRPTYEMTYKGHPVVKPSHLGLELAKDKHATKGFAETSLMDGFTESHSEVSSFDETWKPVWGPSCDFICREVWTPVSEKLATEELDQLTASWKRARISERRLSWVSCSWVS